MTQQTKNILATIINVTLTIINALLASFGLV